MAVAIDMPSLVLILINDEGIPFCCLGVCPGRLLEPIYSPHPPRPLVAPGTRLSLSLLLFDSGLTAWQFDGTEEGGQRDGTNHQHTADILHSFRRLTAGDAVAARAQPQRSHTVRVCSAFNTLGFRLFWYRSFTVKGR